MAMRKLDFIDAIRGIAVLMVLLTHSAQIVKPIGLMSSLSVACAKGVELFFVASAFTLSLSWFSRSTDEVRPVLNFYIRRFFRIAPLFYFGIALYLVIRGMGSHYWAPNGISFMSFLSSVLFLNGVHPEFINAIVPGGWSIAVEMMFYLFFPLIIFYLRDFKRALFFFLLSSFASGIFVFLLRQLGLFSSTPQYLVKNYEYYNLITQLPVFACGFIAYNVFQSKKKSMLFILLSFFVLSVLFLLSHTFSSATLLLKSPSMVGMVFASLLLFFAWCPTKAFVNCFFIFLGKISFSMYLLQFAVFDFFDHMGLIRYFHGNFGSMMFFVLALFVTTCLAHVSFMFIERPGMKLGKLVIGLFNDIQLKRDVKSVP